MMDQGLIDLFAGRSTRRTQPSSPQIVEGLIKSVTADGAYFTVPTWDNGKHVFGPAPWPKSAVEVTSAHDHEATTPPAGSRCLVVFAGTGIESPWVIGWWP